MRIEFSFKNNPRERSMIEGVTSYIQTEFEVLIFNKDGLVVVLSELDIEDFDVYGLGEMDDYS
jgi:hypothetical protein